MNTTSLTAARPVPGRASIYQPRALGLQERAARRLGLALLDWSRRREALRSPETVLLRRRAEQEAQHAMAELQRQLGTLGSPLV
ncbi:hypothetical protein SAMN05428970_0209 [Agromyces sp. CF514]|uniref:hypothetical protein n=1 Tax=Agromyces sp. CF514 TaxID=1881031 RepID=UPI0008EB8D16|nr:hypothetical protein [Agromyces sp. CF514]SFR67427.1 hypothetical protein SAMN05428970_0209 [Agromyces sp. CF514]